MEELEGRSKSILQEDQTINKVYIENSDLHGKSEASFKRRLLFAEGRNSLLL